MPLLRGGAVDSVLVGVCYALFIIALLTHPSTPSREGNRTFPALFCRLPFLAPPLGGRGANN